MKLPLAQVRKIARKRYGGMYWRRHVSIVVKYARKLAKIKKTDGDLAELAALLHDITIPTLGNADHDKTGAAEAAKILRNLKCSEKTVFEIRHAVLTHRGSADSAPKTLLAKILRDADALSHFDAIPMLMFYGLRDHGQDVEKAAAWLDAKLERDWRKKLHFRESRKLAKRKYEAAKLLLRAARKGRK